MYGARPLRSTRRLQNMAAQLPKWWNITNKTDMGQPSLVSIYDEIGMLGVSAGDFLAELAGVNGDLDVHINSPGGDVFDAIAIYNTLKARKGTVSVTIDGLAASAASFIAQAATPGHLEMAPFAKMMIHDGFAMGIGNAADMRNLAKQLDDASDNIAAIYAERTGKPAAYWRAKMKEETWYSDTEAVADGLADRVRGNDEVRNKWDLSVYAKLKRTSVSNDDDDDDDEVERDPSQDTQLGDGWVRGSDGKVRFDPDGDGDDDSCADTDVDHGWWAEDGTLLKPIPATPKTKASKKHVKRAGKVRNADVDESAWDASKAMAAGSQADNPAAFFRAICAGEKTIGDPATQAHWALPYRYTPDSAPNAAAVRNALARLSQTRDLKDPAATRAKLESLMKQVNPDYEPGNHIDTQLLASLLGRALEGGNNG